MINYYSLKMILLKQIYKLVMSGLTSLLTYMFICLFILVFRIYKLFFECTHLRV